MRQEEEKQKSQILKPNDRRYVHSLNVKNSSISNN